MLTKRLARLQQDAEFSPALLEVDAVVSVLDKTDHKQLEDEQRSAGAALAGKDAFQACLHERMAELRLAQPAPGKKRRGANSRMKLAFVLKHSDVSKFAPPGAWVWRSLTRNLGWNGHLPPFQHVSAAHAKYGEHEAPKVVLRRLWECDLTTQGQTPESCPIEGLFQPASSQARSS